MRCALQARTPLIDHLWSTGGLELLHDGARFTRTQKLERIAEDPIAQHTLRVCWQNIGETPNCGRCEKCLRTMVVLKTLGVLDRFRTFPHILTLMRSRRSRMPRLRSGGAKFAS